MNDIIKSIDHIGYAVEDIDAASRILKAFGYTFGPVKTDARRNVRVCIGNGGVQIELLSPIQGKKSPIDGVLEKNGSTPYHVCYRVTDIDRAVDKLRESGFLPIDVPAKSEPLGGEVCFMFSPEIGIIELIS